MQALMQDLRYAARAFTRSPGFTAVVVFSIAVGIAANTTIFSVVNAVLFRELPVERPHELVNVYATERGAGSFLLSYPEYLDIRDRVEVFSEVAAHGMITFSLTIDGAQESATGEVVSNNYFSVLEVQPAIGRAFLSGQSASSDASPTVVLSHQYWRRRFAADPGIIGTTIYVNGQASVVVGVGPRGFTGTFTGVGLDLWVPMRMYDAVMPPSDTLMARDRKRLDVTGRLNPGSSLEQAQAGIALVAQQMEQDFPEMYRDKGLIGAPARGVRPGVQRLLTGFLTALMVIVSLVLLVSCINVAGLLLVRGSARRREIAVRRALGASRWRVMRQLLTESIVLGLIGGAVGLVLTLGATQVFAAYTLANVAVPIQFDLRPDVTVLVFTAVVSVAASVLFGLVPALNGSRTELVSTIKSAAGSGDYRRSRMRGALVVIQIAVSLVLLIGAGLLVRSMRAANRIDPGFSTDGLVIASVELDRLRYDEARGRTLLAELLEQARRTPGVESATLARFIPLSSGSDQRNILIQRAGAPDDRRPRVYYNVVGRDYFRTMRIPVLRGRDFAPNDRMGSPSVVVINQAMAEQFWPEENPIGRNFQMGPSDGASPPLFEIVGIVRDIKYRSTTEPPRPYMYLPFAQEYRGMMTLHLRATGDEQLVLRSILEAARISEPNLPTDNVGPITSTMGSRITGQRLIGGVLAVAGGIALLLAAIGLYAVVAYAASQRTREFGVRVALGARGGDVARFVLWQGLRLCGAGLVVGLVVTYGATRIISNMLFGVSATDPLTYAGVVVIITGVALTASYVPARRATRTDPVAALRAE